MKDHTEALDRAVRLKGSRKRIGRLILKNKAAADALLPEVGGRVYLCEGFRLVFQELPSEDMICYKWLERLMSGDLSYVGSLMEEVRIEIKHERPTKRKYRIGMDRRLLKQLKEFRKGKRKGMRAFEHAYKSMLSKSYCPPARAKRGSIGRSIADFHMHMGTGFTATDLKHSIEDNRGEVLISYRLRRKSDGLYYATIHYFCGKEPARLATFRSFGELLG